MRRTRSAALGLVLLTTGVAYGDLLLPSPAQPVITGTVAISGVVSDGATGRPIAGVIVSLSSLEAGADGSWFRAPSALTDARGRFVFVGLPSTHRYSLFASRAGYAGGEYEGPAPAGITVKTPTGMSVPIHVAEGEWMRDANIRLWRPGSIGGRVVDERGEAVVGTAVRVFSRQMVTGRQQLVQGAVATTDDRGVYRLAYLQPGRYFVAVLSVQATVPSAIPDGVRRLPLGGLEGRGASPPAVTLPAARGTRIDTDRQHRLVLTNFATPPPPGAGRARAYPPVFYPNARAVHEAEPVEIDFGASRGDIDFQLVPIATVRVSGQIIGATQGASNMLLRLMASGTEHLGFGAETATAIVEADNRFTFLNVPAGTYTLVASPSVAEVVHGGSGSQGNLPQSVGYGPAQGLSLVYPAAPGIAHMWWQSEAGADVYGRMSLDVGDSDITGLGVTLQRAATVRGRVIFDDPEQPPPSQRFMVGFEPADGDPLLGAPNAFTAANDPSHAFSIGGLRGGRYLIRFQAFGPWRIKSVTVGGIDVADNVFDGSLAQDFNDVVVTVMKPAGQLSGFALDRDGRPAVGAVILFPTDTRLWVDYGLTPDRLRSSSVDSDGRYKFTSLLDGEYNVVAVSATRADAWLDPAFLAAAASHAAKVSLKAGATMTENLRVSDVIVR